eukprot:CAMPEP_0206028526 /NCGR_PEP_ID=MMETSP1464-20131121/45092_1 /ASSEMBLY_ACC=CAM_ASM_001124 /TAXON_ID=119497 /ORGANISM="Exanthemachrysis gayraliae, Strain RCC1523" /LENGTH=117 /DNA_ID=CAMNT_0053402589 /DNA_START=8 /DNA_END=358 /DNA_ORIENTATION=-
MASWIVNYVRRHTYLRPYLPSKKDDATAEDDELSPLLGGGDADGAGAAAGGENTRQCRICLSTDEPEDIIAPCACSGSVRWVHRACLDEWRAQELRANAFEQCELCKFRYVVETREK